MELPRVSLNLSQTECTCECKPGMSLQFVYYTNSSVLVTLKRVHADSSLLMAVMGSSIGAHTRKMLAVLSNKARYGFLLYKQFSYIHVFVLKGASSRSGTK